MIQYFSYSYKAKFAIVSYILGEKKYDVSFHVIQLLNDSNLQNRFSNLNSYFLVRKKEVCSFRMWVVTSWILILK